MADRVTASSDTLMRQAPMTADLYLGEAIEAVNKRLGRDAAKLHPELVAAFMNAAALDFGASVIARAIESIADREPPYPVA